MALDVNKLKAELLKLIDPNDAGFVGYPADTDEAAANWTAAYDVYSRDAADVSGDSVLTVNPAGFEGAVRSGLVSSVTPVQAATAFGNAFLSYWTGGVFAVGSLPATPTVPCPSLGGNLIWGTEVSSLVTAVVPAGLISLLTTEFAVNTADPDAKATALANAFHTSTTTGITVLITGLDTTPTPGGPLPITNACTVF